MEDSSREPLVEQEVVGQPATESKINRREMAKLLGAVTALSASLGATFITSATTVADGATLQLQFLKSAPNGDPAKAQLLCKIDISPQDQRTLAETEGPVELRIVSSVHKVERKGGVGAGQVTEIVVSSHVIQKAQWNTVKSTYDIKDIKND